MWGIDLISPMPVGKGGVKYAVVTVDCFTKCVEAEPLAAITTKKFKDFIFKNIVCCYGISHTLISDNGKQFDNEEFKQFCDELGIHKKFASVARPQANGQVEAVNKTIKHTLKAKLGATKGNWANDLLEVLWAYRTTPRTSTSETPFLLAYGCKAMIPVEVGTGSLWRDLYNEADNEAFMRASLDLVEEHRGKTSLRILAYQQRTKRFFDSKVK